MFACAVVCLAGAIGAATAVFAIVNSVVLRPLPFQHATFAWRLARRRVK